MEQRISLITLGVRDVETVSAFYDALGWQRVETSDGVVAYDLIGQTLGLYPLEKLWFTHRFCPFEGRFEVQHRSCRRFCAHRFNPAINGLLKGNRVQIVVFEAALFVGHDQFRVFKHAKVLHHAKAGHIEEFRQLLQGLPVFLAQCVQKGAAGRIGEGFEDIIHEIAYR